MPLVSMVELLAAARRGGYAICYCESWSLESFQAVVESAEELRSPIIVGFNGGFLMHPSRPKPENLAFYAGLAFALHKAAVPAAFILNETDSLEQIEQGIEMGFNAVMVDGDRLNFDAYRQLVKQVVRMAHPRNVSVEAQIGRLPVGGLATDPNAQVTDPSLAQRFVEDTGIDALSVSVGNIHVLTKGKAEIDLEALRRISDVVKVPLVLHGGTGVPPEMAKEMIALGIAKVNIGTGLKQAYLAAVREKLAPYRESMPPHPFLGMGGPEDILAAARDAVRNKVKGLLRAYGSADKACKEEPVISGGQ